MKDFTVKSTRQREKIAAIAARIKERTILSPSGKHYVTEDVTLTAPGRVRYVIKANSKVYAWYIGVRTTNSKLIQRPAVPITFDFSRLHIALEDQNVQLTLQMVFEGDELVSVFVTVRGHLKDRRSVSDSRSTKHFDSHNK